MSRVSACVLYFVLVGAVGCNNTSDQRFDFDGDGVEDALDCAPQDPTINADAPDPFGDGIDQNCDGADGVDGDGDGFPLEEEGYEGDFIHWDCNDAEPSVYPGANEIQDDGIDNDCDGVDEVDLDGDGHIADTAGGDDCDDGNANAWPGAPEQADGVDNDCDGVVDEETINFDDDGDGFSEVQGDCDDSDATMHPGDADGDGASLCDGDCDDDDPELRPTDLDQDGFSSCNGDCDDYDATVHPAATEICNLKDDDCDGEQPDGEVDVDLDGEAACEDCDDDDPELYDADTDGDLVSPCDGDCNDDLAYVLPGAADTVGNGLDENCDGVDGTDGDGDGFASVASGGSDCEDSDAAIVPVDSDGDGADPCSGDCDDSDLTVGPAAFDICDDGVDSDCAGDLLDEVDNDGDGWSECAGDCDDADPSLDPVDDDGDGASPCSDDCDDDDILANPNDIDGDGWTSCAGDCNDAQASMNPSSPEVCSLLDEDCDGVQAPDEVDADGDTDPACSDCDDDDPDLHTLDDDGDAVSTCAGDCEDDPAAPAAGNINPLALDAFGDDIDANCDGWDGVDADGDQFASVASGGADCDDTDPGINPLATEIPLDAVDQNCDGSDAADGDGDGYGSLATGGDDCDDTDAAIYPGFFDEPTDGVDSNCDGSDGNETWTFAGSSGDGFAAHPYRVATCDLNGDGFEDLAVGAPLASSDGVCEEGRVSVFLGPMNSGLPVAGADLTLWGNSCDAAVGTAVACAGDTDGDGLNELLVGAPGDVGWVLPSGSTVTHGTVYVVPPGLAGDVTLDGDVPRLGSTNEYSLMQFGTTVLGPGDMNDDGFDDIVVVASTAIDSFAFDYFYGGQVFHVIEGPIVGDTEMPAAGVAQFSLATGPYGCVQCPRNLTGPGDVNGDGRADLLIGHPESFLFGPDRGGATYLFLGPLAGDLTIASAQATLAGSYPEGYAGLSIAGLGDIDNDGFTDLAVVTQQDFAGIFAGTYIVHGPVSGQVDLEFADAIITGVGPGAGGYWWDSTVAAAGDLDGDGLGDLLFSAENLDWSDADGTPHTYEHAVVAIYGPFGGSIGAHTWDAEVFATDIVSEWGNGDWERVAVLDAADLNGDGRPDPIYIPVSTDLLSGVEDALVRVVPNPYDD
jgi:hypothetical protein